MAEDRKEQIYETATHLFAARGYNGTSMRDLARELDLQGGSLYSHIAGKEELLATILDRAADEFLGALLPIARSDRPAIEKLREAVRAHVGVVAANPEAATVYFHEWKFLSAPRYERFVARRREYEQVMRDIVVQGIAEDRFRANIDPKFATLALLSTVNWLYTWYNPAGPLSAIEVADRFFDLLLNGFLDPRAVSEGAHQ